LSTPVDAAKGVRAMHGRQQGVKSPPVSKARDQHANLAGVGLPTGQHVQHLQAGLLVAIMFMLQALFERGNLLEDRRDRVAHRSLPRAGISVVGCRIADLCIAINQNSYQRPKRGVSALLALCGRTIERVGL
jgi:hypothetical protein